MKAPKKRAKAEELAMQLQQLRDLDKCMADLQAMRTAALGKIVKLIGGHK